MILTTLDTTISICQCVFLSYFILFCVNPPSIDRKKLLILSLLFSACSSSVITGTLGDSPIFGTIFAHILGIVIVWICFKKSFFNALTAHTTIYTILTVYSMLFATIVYEILDTVLPYERILKLLLTMYIPMTLLLIICYKYINIIKKLFDFIIMEDFSIPLLILSFFNDFVLSFYASQLNQGVQIIKNLLFITFLIFMMFVLIYFSKMYKKSQQIFLLNEALKNKNEDLRKIKHDYGAQISYLYGLCLMNRYDDLKVSLKNIIDNNSSVSSSVQISNNNNNNNSILYLALEPALKKEIHVILKEECDLQLADIDEMDLFRIISNIVNNAITALDGQGIIIAKAYELLNSIVIKIENNGPQIPEDYIEKIFTPGFSTKTDSCENHGFGLNIVKDLVEQNNGKISLKSTETSTEFTITLRLKSDNVNIQIE
ncbi:MAG: ATP-binding protein [Clostridium sp.]|nr:ATP-binding protein [Clostridium sp.]